MSLNKDDWASGFSVDPEAKDKIMSSLEDSLALAKLQRDLALLEISCLRSVLSEWEQDKSCYVQWNEAENLRQRRDNP